MTQYRGKERARAYATIFDDDDFELPVKRHSSGSKAIFKELHETKELGKGFLTVS